MAPRESDGLLYTPADPEVGATTKAFLTRLVAYRPVSPSLAQGRTVKFGDEINAVIAQLANIPK